MDNFGAEGDLVHLSRARLATHCPAAGAGSPASGAFTVLTKDCWAGRIRFGQMADQALRIEGNADTTTDSAIPPGLDATLAFPLRWRRVRCKEFNVLAANLDADRRQDCFAVPLGHRVGSTVT